MHDIHRRAPHQLRRIPRRTRRSVPGGEQVQRHARQAARRIARRLATARRDRPDVADRELGREPEHEHSERPGRRRCRPVRSATSACSRAPPAARNAPCSHCTVRVWASRRRAGWSAPAGRSCRRRRRHRLASPAPAAPGDRAAGLLVRDRLRVHLGRDPRPVPPDWARRGPRRIAPAGLGVRPGRNDDRRGLPHLHQRQRPHPASTKQCIGRNGAVRAVPTSRSTSPQGRMRCATASRSRPDSSSAATDDAAIAVRDRREFGDRRRSRRRARRPTAGTSRSSGAIRSGPQPSLNASAATPSSPTSTASTMCETLADDAAGALRPHRPSREQRGRTRARRAADRPTATSSPSSTTTCRRSCSRSCCCRVLEASVARVITTASNANAVDRRRRRRPRPRPQAVARRMAGLRREQARERPVRRELARRSSVGRRAFHPGFVSTQWGAGHRAAAVLQGGRRRRTSLAPPEEGAAPLVHLATVETVRRASGTYFDGVRPDGRTHRQGRDPQLAARLWEQSLELTASESVRGDEPRRTVGRDPGVDADSLEARCRQHLAEPGIHGSLRATARGRARASRP